MTSQELKDFILDPIRADLSEIRKDIAHVKAQVESNTLFRYKIYGGVAILVPLMSYIQSLLVQ